MSTDGLVSHNVRNTIEQTVSTGRQITKVKKKPQKSTQLIGRGDSLFKKL